ncbi:acetyl/propionyl/methylcrotonyl-CoA carboxylase subunit alpha [Dongia soli]|uniref:Biotin carboxylase N-terminal domain-containing protein n=1 Tax=Dongia soli TaxID=600628 RepID=A0ABU5E8R5_9PROT|nr:biotin carboxylase N-terminal domain-containing protein [Dongia soli]MDY0882747.1 biotin carboxylase N-terminal domain-containing protein [Dongia soli]
MFERLLIANRGEIACRIIRTARRLGLHCIAIYSDPDATAQHVRLADEAYPVGPAAVGESYLNIDAVIKVALASGAEAVHPGYGFLSENADFAEACLAAGLCFVGPPPDTIRLMGDKAAAKRLAAAIHMPLVPGYDGNQREEAFTEAAARIGYPVLLKAAAGGGGRGMRVVRHAEDLGAAIAGARREAKASFGQDTLLLEKYVEHARHVEVQIFGDRFGNVVYLGDRDCSLQRRHQKLIEEAPAPHIPREIREAMAEAGVELAKAAKYLGAGTVEFLYTRDKFYFIEMNTRLQVEHPVTEMITGLDLVEWQLRVAAGEALPVTQEWVHGSGHAVEIRLCAEDPMRDFVPTGGRILHLSWPRDLPGRRIDAGMIEGDIVGTYYDSMLGKLIAWGETRKMALARLRQLIAETHLAGVMTNRDFTRTAIQHPEFVSAEFDTAFFERHAASLIQDNSGSDLLLALAGLAVTLRPAVDASGLNDPWTRLVGWELNLPIRSRQRFHLDGVLREVSIWSSDGQNWHVQVGGHRSFDIQNPALFGQSISAAIGKVAESAKVIFDGPAIWMMNDEKTLCLMRDEPMARADAVGAGPGSLTAPMPGTIVQILIKPGDIVTKGNPLIILEAMKMEHVIRAPHDGTVAAVHFIAGQQVKEGADLLTLAAEGGSQ